MRIASTTRIRLLPSVLALLLLAACASGGPVDSPAGTSKTGPQSPAATSPVAPADPTASPVVTSAPSALPSGSGDASCGTLGVATARHDSPEVEAILPARVAGRDLLRWSVVGRCWLEMAMGDYPGGVDALLAEIAGVGGTTAIDPDHLVYGIAGRSNTSTDPPYFVWAAARPYDDTEIQLAMAMLFGGAGYFDIARAADRSQYTHQVIGDRDVFVGDVSMLTQDTHQRGRPYLYQTDSWMFIVLTDDDTWATDAISQLP